MTDETAADGRSTPTPEDAHFVSELSVEICRAIAFKTASLEAGHPRFESLVGAALCLAIDVLTVQGERMLRPTIILQLSRSENAFIAAEAGLGDANPATMQ